MIWKENKWIKFLEGYCQGKNQIQDEYVRKVASQLNISPLEINFPWQEEIIDKFKDSKDPSLIILTGTAGDGKTKLCRDIVKSIDGHEFNESEWNKTSYFTSEKRIIVKDFSELNKSEKEIIIKELLKVLTNGLAEKQILIAVNDGILVESLEEYIKEIDDDFVKKEVKKIKEIIEDKINLGFSNIPGNDLFNLINLSKLNAKNNIELIVNSIIENNNWNECDGCVGKIEEKCPIYNKYKLIRDNSTILKNLSNIILLLQLNDEHFTIRELLNLSANIILASAPKHRSLRVSDYQPKKEVLDCKTISLAKEDEISNLKLDSTVEVGFWGMNIGINKMRSSRPYSEINKLGFGNVSSNYWDKKINSSELRSFTIPMDKLKLKDEHSEDYDSFIKRSRIQLYCYQSDNNKAYDLQSLPAFYDYFNEIYSPLERGVSKVDRVKTIDNLVLALNRIFHGRYISKNSGSGKLYIPQEGLGSLIPVSIFHGYDIDESNIYIQTICTDANRLTGSRVEPYLIINDSTNNESDFKLSFPVELYDYLIKVANGAPPNITNPRLYKKLLILRSRLSTFKKNRRVQMYKINQGDFKYVALEVDNA